MSIRQRADLYFIHSGVPQDHLQLVETIKKRKWNRELLQGKQIYKWQCCNVRRLAVWRCGLQSRYENIKPLVPSVRYKRRPETRLCWISMVLKGPFPLSGAAPKLGQRSRPRGCVNCSQRAGIDDIKLNEEPMTNLNIPLVSMGMC